LKQNGGYGDHYTDTLHSLRKIVEFPEVLVKENYADALSSLKKTVEFPDVSNKYY